MDKRLNDKIVALAIAYHKTIEGEYGCPGKECPGVKNLVAFGAQCASAAIDEAMRVVRETPTK
jgi:hypothetical protein